MKNPSGGDEASSVSPEFILCWLIDREQRYHKSVKNINENIASHSQDTDPAQLNLAYMDEWNVTGASAVPWELVLEQREKYFKGIRFRTVDEILKDAEVMERV